MCEGVPIEYIGHLWVLFRVCGAHFLQEILVLAQVCSSCLVLLLALLQLLNLTFKV